jgi:TatA/E family protein of Tat protein translocase
MIGGLSMTEVIIILGLALLLLGPDQLPTLAKSLGKGLKELRKATDDIKGQFESEIARIDLNEPAKPAPSIAPVPPDAGGALEAPKENDPASARAAARRAALNAAQLTLVPQGTMPEGTVPREMPREVVPPASWVRKSAPVPAPAGSAQAIAAQESAPAAHESAAAQEAAPAAQEAAAAAQEAAAPETPPAPAQEQKA